MFLTEKTKTVAFSSAFGNPLADDRGKCFPVSLKFGGLCYMFVLARTAFFQNRCSFDNEILGCLSTHVHTDKERSVPNVTFVVVSGYFESAEWSLLASNSIRKMAWNPSLTESA